MTVGCVVTGVNGTRSGWVSKESSFVASLFLVGNIGRGSTLATWLLFAVGNCCASSCAKSLRKAQILAMTGARTSVRTRWKGVS